MPYLYYSIPYYLLLRLTSIKKKKKHWQHTVLYGSLWLCIKVSLNGKVYIYVNQIHTHVHAHMCARVCVNQVYANWYPEWLHKFIFPSAWWESLCFLYFDLWIATRFFLHLFLNSHFILCASQHASRWQSVTIFI